MPTDSVCRAHLHEVGTWTVASEAGYTKLDGKRHNFANGKATMIRAIAMAGMMTLGLTALASAQAPKADCSKFKKTTDGRWMSTIDAKIGNPKDFKHLLPGIPIERNETIVGINVSDTLDRLCGGQ